MKTVTIKNGFQLTVDEVALNDMEMLDAIAEAQSEDPLRISFVIKKLLGNEQRKKLYDFLRDESGKVPIDAVTEAVTEVFNALGEEGKNS